MRDKYFELPQVFVPSNVCGVLSRDSIGMLQRCVVVTFSYKFFKQTAVAHKICYSTYIELTKSSIFDNGGEDAARP